jgi:protein involved in polysaccharide export with SLBB domain
MQFSLRLSFISAAFVAVGLNASALAQTPTPAMIEQFKSLPRAQQEALAQQYGIDLSAVTGGMGRTVGVQLAQPGQALPQATQPLTPVLQSDETKDQDEKTLSRFGMDLFDAAKVTFAPTDDTQIPADYRLGIGDELVIQMFGKENSEVTLQINREGEISLPKLGPISISGLAFVEASRLIKERIQEQLLGVDAVVAVGGLRSINVFMAGEVNVPGAYSMNALTTVTQALFQAGGISDIGSLREVQVKRNGVLVESFDVYDLLMRGDTSADIRLQSGDVVFVPTYQHLVQVHGEVKRPMEYEVTGDETLQDVLNMAGGFTSTALESKVVLVQKTQGDRLPSATNIDTSNSVAMSKPLQDGDQVRVYPVSEALDNVVSLEGAVVREGDYGWQVGLRLSDLISDVRRDLSPNVDLQYGLILREMNPELDMQIIQFSPIDVITQLEPNNDPVLNPRDRVLFFDYVQIKDDENKTLQERLTDKANKQREYEMLWSQNQRESQQANRNVNDNLRPQSNSVQNNAQYPSVENVDQQEVDLASEYEARESKSKEDKEERFDREELLEPVLKKLKSQADENMSVKIASISGAVKLSGEYPISQDATLQDLVIAAGGLKDSAFLRSVELRRIVEKANGEVVAEYQNFDLSNSSEMSNIAIQSRDHVNVRMNTDWNPTDSVELSGQVRFPGTYLIQPGETLSQVIVRAGGLKRDAFPQGAVFTRQEIAELENERAAEFAESLRRDFASSLLTEESVNSTYEEVALITQKLEMFEGQGRLLIDLPSALNGDPSSNIEVVDGDKLHIPKVSNTVTVVGEVRRQGTHTYQSGFDLDDYLALGAGPTARADEGAIYIVKANGSVVIPETSLTQFSSGAEQLSPGDTIIVPVDAQHKESITLWRDITQIVYQSTVAIAAVARL